MNQFGPPPSIGFNSAFAYDFDPSEGIDADKVDFEAVAFHEIGHVLGFGSFMGDRELEPTAPTLPTLLDMFRFRPGITLPNFANTNRLLFSGGDQIFLLVEMRLPYPQDVRMDRAETATREVTGKPMKIQGSTLASWTRQSALDNVSPRRQMTWLRSIRSDTSCGPDLPSQRNSLWMMGSSFPESRQQASRSP